MIQPSLNSVEQEVNTVKKKIKHDFIHISLEMRNFLNECIEIDPKQRPHLSTLQNSKWLKYPSKSHLEEEESCGVADYLF